MGYTESARDFALSERTHYVVTDVTTVTRPSFESISHLTFIHYTGSLFLDIKCVLTTNQVRPAAVCALEVHKVSEIESLY